MKSFCLALLVALVPWTAHAAFPHAVAVAPEIRMDPTTNAPTPTPNAGLTNTPSSTPSTARDVILTGESVVIGPHEKVHDVIVTRGDAVIEGEVTGNLVVVFGRAVIRGMVHGDAVNIGSGLVIEQGGQIKEDAVAIGYGIECDRFSAVDGEIINIGLTLVPESFRSRLSALYHECIVLMRPLSWNVDFVWWIWAFSLGLQAVLSMLFPGTTRSLQQTLTDRPLDSLLIGIVAVPLSFVVVFILALSLVGALALPLTLPLVAGGVLIGRAAILRVIGIRCLQALGLSSPTPAAAFATGAIALSGLFLVPFLGFLTWSAINTWALGAVCLALIRRNRPETPDPATHPSRNAPSPAITPDPIASNPSTQTDGPPVTTMNITPTLLISDPVPPAEPPPSPEVVATAARPDFARRLTALIIDWVPILIVLNLLPEGLERRLVASDLDGLLRVAAGVAYFTLFIAWRGSTPGGIITGVRVVRLDGTPVDRKVALVRSLAAILSTACLGLGWFAASWDLRTWHDRLAGTVVIRDPKPRSLI